MKSLWVCILSFIFWIFSSAFLNSYAASFNIPERLVYDLTWGGIKVGTASLEITDDGDRLKIISKTRSAKLISVFYTVDDRIESILFKNSSFSHIGEPVNYKVMLKEGKYRRNREVIFDHINNRAKHIDYLKNKNKEYDIPPFIFDPISGFYYLRTLRLAVGKPLYLTVFDSEKVWNTEVQVLKKEKVDLPIGTFDTIVVKPLIKSEGIFYRKGEILIWLTDDMKHLPVKVETKVPIGHITAILIQADY
ncbi:MAG: DUF3108 domain-containing protein [Nitrospirota bacterium]